MRSPRLSAASLAFVACLALLLAGCPKPAAESPPDDEPSPLSGATLRLGVVDDPAIAAAVVQARGEWNAQTGAELEVVELSGKLPGQSEDPPVVDALIIPSHMLGEAVEAGLAEPIPKAVTASDQWAGVFDLLKLREAAWGDRVVAVPFGSPVFCCCYRPDLLEKLGRKPPQTWNEYRDLAGLLAAEKPEGVQTWSGAIEPLSPGWAGLTLLARVAPAAKHRSNYSTLFNIETMEPLIAGPPFVEALESLVAAAKFAGDDPLRFDPAEARRAFWRGECGMAITWPTAAATIGEVRKEGGKSPSTDTSSPPVGFVELPGSQKVYNVSEDEWEKRSDREDCRVPLLAIAGRLGVVPRASSDRAAAVQLLVWLSDDAMSARIIALSPDTTMFRQANLDAPGQWVEKTVPHSAAVQYGDATVAALSHEQWLAALRIPGRAEYLTALDEAVAAAVRGEQPPLEALKQAADKWRKITNRLGLEKQRAAYGHSVGL